MIININYLGVTLMDKKINEYELIEYEEKDKKHYEYVEDEDEENNSIFIKYDDYSEMEKIYKYAEENIDDIEKIYKYIKENAKTLTYKEYRELEKEKYNK
jgi:hypothetical protein